MPPPQVKDVVKDFVKDLGKVFAIRLRRSTKNGRTRCSSTTTDHEIGASIPVHTPSQLPTLPSNSSQVHAVSANRELDLEASTNVSSARYSGGVSLVRGASDMAQLALPLVQAVASAIPLVGAPMQAAIGGLVMGLQAIDRHNQNKADLNNLTLRLDRLSRELCNATPASDPVEQSRRDSFVRMLEDTSARMTVLHERCLASTPVTQAIAGCFIEIDRYLADYLWSSQMQSQRDIREVLVILQRERDDRHKLLTTIESLVTRGQFSLGPTAAQLIGTATRGCVTLIDATGHQHAISVNFCTSFEQFNEMLKALFKCNSAEAQIQRRYMESGKFDLCIDEGPQVSQLTSHRWSRPEVGTTIVMRVIVEQQKTASSDFCYRCSCGAVNILGVGSIMYSFERQAGCSIDCRKCGRRFQISRVPARAKRISSTQSSHIDSDHRTDAGMDLIRNFLVQQTELGHSIDGAFQCLWSRPGGLQCNHIFFGRQLSVHLREFHGIRGADKLPVLCLWNGCGMYLRGEALSTHITRAHFGIRYPCDACGKMFSHPHTLNCHKKCCLGLQQ